MTLAGKILSGMGLALLVLMFVLQAAAPETAEALAIPMWLLLIIGGVLWSVGARQDARS